MWEVRHGARDPFLVRCLVVALYAAASFNVVAHCVLGVAGKGRGAGRRGDRAIGEIVAADTSALDIERRQKRVPTEPGRTHNDVLSTWFQLPGSASFSSVGPTAAGSGPRGGL
ncbi:hypothetical protein FMEAI12_2770006 [Parafrankia sp. Ea1.12]|nr:hypothetical protein FMEAI12_2770006 [Parafrankia sp. Ea1.12]